MCKAHDKSLRNDNGCDTYSLTEKRYVGVMPSRHTLTVSLTPELARFVADEVGSVRYGSASEVMHAGLRLLSGPGTGAVWNLGEQEAPRQVGAPAVRAAKRAEEARG